MDLIVPLRLAYKFDIATSQLKYQNKDKFEEWIV